MGNGSTTNLGKKGEGIAVAFLRKKGFTILDRNYRFRKAEIDIIAMGEGFLVVLEVKTRSGAFYESLAESIPKQKVRRLIAAADQYVREKKYEMEIRFDVIQVILGDSGHVVHHIKDAFYFF